MIFLIRKHSICILKKLKVPPFLSLKHLIYLRLSLQRASKLPPFWRDYSYLVYSVLFCASVGSSVQSYLHLVTHCKVPTLWRDSLCEPTQRRARLDIERHRHDPLIISSEFNRRARQTTRVLLTQKNKAKAMEKVCQTGPSNLLWIFKG